MRVILARHADAKNSEGVFHGLKDEPLTRNGEKEAQSLAEDLRQYNPAIIYTSPLKRSKRTAEIVGEELGVPIKVANELKPLDLGDFVGKDTDEYLDDVRYFLKNTDEKIPGSSQSVDDWAGKYIPFFNKVKNIPSKQTVVMVTHGRNIILTKADLEEGGSSNPNYKKAVLTSSDESLEHAGIAVSNDGVNKVEILDPKSVKAGQS